MRKKRKSRFTSPFIRSLGFKARYESEQSLRAPTERIALALPNVTDTVTESDIVLAKYGSNVYLDMYYGDALSKNLVDLLVSYVLVGGVNVSSNYPNFLERINSALGENLLSIISEAYTRALVMGTSFTEILWDDVNGAILPTGLKTLSHAQAFKMSEEEGYEDVAIGVTWGMTEYEMENEEGELELLEYVPLERLLVLKGLEIFDSPWGLSIYRPVFKDYYNRRSCIKSTAIYVDKLAIPHMQLNHMLDKDGNIMEVDEQEKQRLYKDVEALQNNFVISPPAGLKLDPLQTGNANTNFLQDIIDLFSKAQCRGIIGTSALIMESKFGTYAAAIAQEPVMQNIIAKQAEYLGSSLIEQIYSRCYEYNGITDAKIEVDFKLPDVSTTSKLENAERVVKAGWRLGKRTIADIVGVEESEVQEKQASGKLFAVAKDKSAKKRMSSSKYTRDWYNREMRRLEKRSEPYRARIKRLLAYQAKHVYSGVGSGKPIEIKPEVLRLTAETMVAMRLWIESQVDSIMGKRFGKEVRVLFATKGLPMTKTEWLATEQGRVLGSEAFEQYYNESLAVTEGMYGTMTKMATDLFSDPTIAKQEAFSMAIQRAAVSANTTWQTEFTRFFAEAQENWRTTNLTKNDVPGFEFLNPNDEHTSDICSPYIGNYYSYNDPNWKELQPPLHPNCRSFLSPVDRIEAEVTGIVFDTVPGTLL